MEHLVLLLYLTALISGVIWTNLLRNRIKESNSPIVKAYRNIFLNYTLLIFCASILTYVLINLKYSDRIMLILAAAMMIVSSPMCYFQALMHYRIQGWKWESRSNIIFSIPIVTALFASLSIFFINQIWLLALVVGVQTSLICLTPLVLHIISLKRGQKREISPRQKTWQLVEILFSLGLTGMEFLMRRQQLVETGIIISLPLVYLLMNLLHFWKRDELMPYLRGKKSHEDYGLTPKEVEIVQAIAAGQSNKEIAFNMEISPSTVKNHIYNIYQKTGAQGRVDLLNRLK